jgi:hypothetical protein
VTPGGLRARIAALPRSDRIVYGTAVAALAALVLSLGVVEGAKALEPRLEKRFSDLPPAERPPLVRAVLWTVSHKATIDAWGHVGWALVLVLLVSYEVVKRTGTRLRAPADEPWHEAPHALLLAITPATLLSAVAFYVAYKLGFFAPGAEAPAFVVVPLPVAIAATCYAASFVLVLAYRLARGRDEPPG